LVERGLQLGGPDRSLIDKLSLILFRRQVEIVSSPRVVLRRQGADQAGHRSTRRLATERVGSHFSGLLGHRLRHRSDLSGSRC
jgi:hypothetical protein